MLRHILGRTTNNRRARETGILGIEAVIAAYGGATAVSLARFAGENHFLSDVLIGSAIEYGIGRYVYRTNHNPSLDTANSTSKPLHNHWHLIPAAFPNDSRSACGYGVHLAWAF